MMMPTVMAKGVVAKMAARYRATAMLDGECAGDGLTCTEDQSQNQNRSDCLATHYKHSRSVIWRQTRSRANINLVTTEGTIRKSG
jgi:hypothetical protein